MTRSDAQAHFQKLIDEADTLVASTHETEGVTEWRNNVKTAVRRIFKDGATYVVEFESIRYRPSVATSNADYHFAFQRGMKKARAFVKSRLEEINSFWESAIELGSGEDLKHSGNPNTVFVIHGRQKLGEFHAFLRAIGLTPLEWSQARKLVKKSTPYTWEIVDEALIAQGQ